MTAVGPERTFVWLALNVRKPPRLCENSIVAIGWRKISPSRQGRLRSAEYFSPIYAIREAVSTALFRRRVSTQSPPKPDASTLIVRSSEQAFDFVPFVKLRAACSDSCQNFGAFTCATQSTSSPGITPSSRSGTDNALEHAIEGGL
jgi:hypothetical protein